MRRPRTSSGSFSRYFAVPPAGDIHWACNGTDYAGNFTGKGIIALLTDQGRRGLFAAWIGFRALTNPVAFGVAAAVFDARGKVLLVRQSYAAGWRLPGGGAARGEPPETAMRRELSEEVGLSGGTAQLFGIYVRKTFFATNVVALYRVTGAGIAFRPNWEVREILFADPASLPADTAPATRRRLAELCVAEKPSHFW